MICGRTGKEGHAVQTGEKKGNPQTTASRSISAVPAERTIELALLSHFAGVRPLIQ
jgi:hypothetical protein